MCLVARAMLEQPGPPASSACMLHCSGSMDVMANCLLCNQQLVHSRTLGGRANENPGVVAVLSEFGSKLQFFQLREATFFNSCTIALKMGHISSIVDQSKVKLCGLSIPSLTTASPPLFHQLTLLLT